MIQQRARSRTACRRPPITAWRGIGQAAVLTLLVALTVAAIRPPAAAAAVGSWPTMADIQAKAWVVLDRQSGKIMMENQADLKVYPASTTKILTAIIALESGQLDRTIQVSETATDLPSGSSKVGYLAGEEVVLRDVLAGLLIASGNDAANVLAEALAGDNAAFAVLMNQKAAVLGMTGSHFTNPSGLQDPEHFVTARDMARLAAYAMHNEAFRALVATRSISLPPTNLHPYYGWAIFNNTNRLLQYGDTYLKSDWLADIEGVKTGSTNEAGNNLVAAAVSTSGQELVSVLMGVPLSLDGSSTFVYSRTILEEAAKLGGATPAVTTGPTTTAETTATTSTTHMTTAATSAATTTTTASATPAISGLPSPAPTGALPTPPADELARLERAAGAWRSAFLALALIWLATIFTWLIRRNRYRARHEQAGIRPSRRR
jgi:D-alanyl-D-alanine carboxypeptidase